MWVYFSVRHAHTLTRELGTLKMLVDFFRAFIKCTYANADGLLAELSDRYVAAAKELGLPHVPLFFAVRHGRLSSDHFRTLAHVFEVVICDEPKEPARRAVHDVLAWYWATRATSFNAAGIQHVQELGLRMLTSLEFFDTPQLRALYHEATKVHVSALRNVPKVHRAVSHLPGYIREFGPYEDLTTEASEAANKPLKQMFRMYAIASPACLPVPVSA